jgi:hypothetical protein
MEKNKLKELVKSYIDEMSATTGAGGFMGKMMVKNPQKEGTTKTFNRNPARTKTAQDVNSPTGFESMPDSAKTYIKGKFRIIKPEERIDAKDLWKEESLNEVRYSQFKTQSKTRSPQEQLHMGVKEIYRKLDEINKLVEFTSRMKTELKGDADEMNFLKRTHNSLFKINEKIQSINEKIKGLTE